MSRKKRQRKIAKQQLDLLWQPAQDLWCRVVETLEKDPVSKGVAKPQSTPELEALRQAAWEYMDAMNEVVELQRRFERS